MGLGVLAAVAVVLFHAVPTGAKHDCAGVQTLEAHDGLVFLAGQVCVISDNFNPDTQFHRSLPFLKFRCLNARGGHHRIEHVLTGSEGGQSGIIRAVKAIRTNKRSVSETNKLSLPAACDETFAVVREMH